MYFEGWRIIISPPLYKSAMHLRDGWYFWDIFAIVYFSPIFSLWFLWVRSRLSDLFKRHLLEVTLHLLYVGKTSPSTRRTINYQSSLQIVILNIKFKPVCKYDYFLLYIMMFIKITFNIKIIIIIIIYIDHILICILIFRRPIEEFIHARMRTFKSKDMKSWVTEKPEISPGS